MHGISRTIDAATPKCTPQVGILLLLLDDQMLTTLTDAKGDLFMMVRRWFGRESSSWSKASVHQHSQKGQWMRVQGHRWGI